MKITKTVSDTRESDVAVHFKMVVGVMVNIIIIISIIALIGRNESGSNATAYHLELRSESNPWEHQEVTLTDVSSAASAANLILAGMQSDPEAYGSFFQINQQCDRFMGVFYLDHDIGNVLYWELRDRNVTVWIDAIEEKIIHYSRTSWSDGSFDEEAAEGRAENILTGFHGSIPNDAEDPTCSLDQWTTTVLFNSTTNEKTYANRSYWTIRYDRVWDSGQGSGQDKLPTEDFVVVNLDKSGTCTHYSYIWYMDLDSVNKNYSVDQQDAESTATSYAGQGSVVVTTEKMIVRPNYFWPVAGGPTDDEDEPTSAYGEDPIIVYAIWVRHSEIDDDLWMYHVDGRENEIVGGY